ncbi:Senescence regulator S40 [Forsythia ovata]|uniref:Senescence regulator S40 n=1 Tax=Forsythia ovata TaxID=205694 RepID=A0ABD1S6J5_9LAMI
MEAMRGGLSRYFSLSHSKAEVEDDIGELQEEDVWYNQLELKAKRESDQVAVAVDRQVPTPTKVVASRRSAPMRIPDWSKIYQIKPRKELWDDECDLVKALIGIKIHTKILTLLNLMMVVNLSHPMKFWPGGKPGIGVLPTPCVKELEGLSREEISQE